MIEAGCENMWSCKMMAFRDGGFSLDVSASMCMQLGLGCCRLISVRRESLSKLFPVCVHVADFIRIYSPSRYMYMLFFASTSRGHMPIHSLAQKCLCIRLDKVRTESMHHVSLFRALSMLSLSLSRLGTSSPRFLCSCNATFPFYSLH